MRAAIYARYSSDLQRNASIEDQIEVCRRFANLQGWEIGKVYADRAVSGASTARPEYQELFEAAALGQFDIVLAESLDRLSRKVADVATLQETLAFNGIKLHTVATGEVTALLAGILGSVSQQYLLDLKEKTKRGQLGRALQGKIPGGKAYGYKVLPGTDQGAGDREIIPDQASVVTRIFQEYALGKSPAHIARDLNTEHVPGPEGRAWRDTTIRGQVDRGTGLLNNSLYVGRLEWNRCSYVKDPQTGKRVARVNPKDQWEIVEVPHLRIIDDTLWNRVKDRQQRVATTITKDVDGNALNRVHRKRYLLSGLLVCSECGGGYTIVGKDRYGCANRNRGKSTCQNTKTIKRQVLEERILRSLKERLVTPDLVKIFVEGFQKEVERLTRQDRKAVERHHRSLAEINRKIKRIMDAIEDGLYTPDMKVRMEYLQSEKDSLTANIKRAETEPTPITLHPNLHELYARQVSRLEEALNDTLIKTQAVDLIQSLIERIELTPDPKAANGIEIALQGELANILSVCAAADGNKKLPVAIKRSGSQLSVVAGAGFEPATFRL
jgi:site-specific DNA recombinase